MSYLHSAYSVQATAEVAVVPFSDIVYLLDPEQSGLADAASFEDEAAANQSEGGNPLHFLNPRNGAAPVAYYEETEPTLNNRGALIAQGINSTETRSYINTEPTTPIRYMWKAGGNYFGVVMSASGTFSLRQEDNSLLTVVQFQTDGKIRVFTTAWADVATGCDMADGAAHLLEMIVTDIGTTVEILVDGVSQASFTPRSWASGGTTGSDFSGLTHNNGIIHRYGFIVCERAYPATVQADLRALAASRFGITIAS